MQLRCDGSTPACAHHPCDSVQLKAAEDTVGRLKKLPRLQNADPGCQSEPLSASGVLL